jgi:type I restriction enzyme S subunit
VQRGRLDLTTVKQIALSMTQAERLRLRHGDVLLNEGGDRDKVGRGWVWEGQLDNCVFQNHVFRARPRHEDIQPRWISHYLNEAARSYFLAGSKQTTNLASLSLSKVAATPVAVPPADEQRRIIQSVDGLVAELHDVEAAMKRARERMADYRASLLHAACTGALTTGWRDANPHPEEDGPALLRRILAERRAAWEGPELARLTAAGKVPAGDWWARYPTPAIGPQRGVSQLPATWTWATVQQLGFVSGGLTVNAGNRTGTSEHPYLRVANVAEGSLNLGDVRSISVSPSEAVRIVLRPDDLLFVEGNGSADQIGRVALWDGSIPGCVHQNHLIKFRGASPHMSRWLLLWFMSPLGKRVVQAAASSTSGLHTLSISKIAGLPVPLPPVFEVERIVDITSEHQELRADLPVVMTGSTLELRQSILHAAFSGRLVPQDPDDEPATTLLARLRADAAPSTPRRRTTRAGARP